jgi:spermidine/putrescine transport system ATP-binding protein
MSSEPRSKPEHAVRLIDVAKTFRGGVDAVRGITFDVWQGEFFAILGPSGSGKSTTLRIIGGFETASSGTVLIQGEDVGNRPPFQRDVNTVFQSYALFPHLDVFDNVGFGLRMEKVKRAERAERVASVLETVQLTHLARRAMTELSGGEQQRVALARALVKRPQVLLLDEPLGALDLKLRKEMQLELKAIQEQVGLTFIHVTHDQDEAMALADRIAVMHRGSIAQIGAPPELYDRPRNRFVAEFIGRVYIFSGTVSSADGAVLLLDVPELGRLVAARTNDAVPAGRGATVTVAVRPEMISLAERTEAGRPASGERDNAYPGRLVRSAYGATATLYEVALDSGRTVEVVVPRPERDRHASLGAGADVILAWSAQAAVPVADE